VPAKTDPATTRRRPRQARAIATRERLMREGRSAFARLGHDGVNLERDILEPAGVSVGSFYHQFADKTDLLLEIMGESAEARRDAVFSLGLQTPDAGSFEEALAAGWAVFFDSLDRDEDGWRLNLGQVSSESRITQTVLEGREMWARQLAEFLAGGQPVGSRERSVAMSLLAFAMGIAAVYLDLPKTERRKRRADLIEGAQGFAAAGCIVALHDQPRTWTHRIGPGRQPETDGQCARPSGGTRTSTSSRSERLS
jgi:AcrR family transcriptional regulator